MDTLVNSGSTRMIVDNPWSKEDTEAFLSEVKSAIKENTQENLHLEEYQVKDAFFPFVFYLLYTQTEPDVLLFLSRFVSKTVLSDFDILEDKEWEVICENTFQLFLKFGQVPHDSFSKEKYRMTAHSLRLTLPNIAEYQVNRGIFFSAFLNQVKEALKSEELYSLALFGVDSILEKVRYTSLIEILTDSLIESFENKRYACSNLILRSINKAAAQIKLPKDCNILTEVCKMTVLMLELNPLEFPEAIVFHTFVLGFRNTYLCDWYTEDFGKRAYHLIFDYFLSQISSTQKLDFFSPSKAFYKLCRDLANYFYAAFIKFPESLVNLENVKLVMTRLFIPLLGWTSSLNAKLKTDHLNLAEFLFTKGLKKTRRTSSFTFDLSGYEKELVAKQDISRISRLTQKYPSLLKLILDLADEEPKKDLNLAYAYFRLLGSLAPQLFKHQVWEQTVAIFQYVGLAIKEDTKTPVFIQFCIAWCSVRMLHVGGFSEDLLVRVLNVLNHILLSQDVWPVKIAFIFAAYNAFKYATYKRNTDLPFIVKICQLALDAHSKGFNTLFIVDYILQNAYFSKEHITEVIDASVNRILRSEKKRHDRVLELLAYVRWVLRYRSDFGDYISKTLAPIVLEYCGNAVYIKDAILTEFHAALMIRGNISLDDDVMWRVFDMLCMMAPKLIKDNPDVFPSIMGVYFVEGRREVLRQRSENVIFLAQSLIKVLEKIQPEKFAINSFGNLILLSQALLICEKNVGIPLVSLLPLVEYLFGKSQNAEQLSILFSISLHMTRFDPSIFTRFSSYFWTKLSNQFYIIPDRKKSHYQLILDAWTSLFPSLNDTALRFFIYAVITYSPETTFGLLTKERQLNNSKQVDMDALISAFRVTLKENEDDIEEWDYASQSSLDAEDLEKTDEVSEFDA